MPKQLNALFCQADSPPTWSQACSYRATSVLKKLSKTTVPFYTVRMGSEKNVPEKFQLCFVVCEGWL